MATIQREHVFYFADATLTSSRTIGNPTFAGGLVDEHTYRLEVPGLVEYVDDGGNYPAPQLYARLEDPFSGTEEFKPNPNVHPTPRSSWTYNYHDSWHAGSEVYGPNGSLSYVIYPVWTVICDPEVGCHYPTRPFSITYTFTVYGPVKGEGPPPPPPGPTIMAVI